MERVIETISKVAGHVSGWIVILIMMLTVVEVITRYALRQPLILCDEFGGYSLFAISFIGLSFCAWENGHIRITFLVEKLQPRTQIFLRVFTLLLGLFYVAVASKVSWDFLVFSFQRNMRSNSWLMTPLKWPQMAMPVGFTLFALVLLFQVIQAIGKIKENRTPEGPVRENHGS